MNLTRKCLSGLGLAVLLALTLIAPARAFDGPGGDKVVVQTGITLLLIGWLLLWLFPRFIGGLSAELQSRPLPSLRWGAVAWPAFFFVLLLIVTGTIIGVGILAFIGLMIGFILVTTFVAKIVFGTALGSWILQRLNSPLAEHRYWPMVVGVLITVAVIALLSFPLIPGILGWLLNFAIVLLGLGALWLLGRERMVRRQRVSVA